MDYDGQRLAEMMYYWITIAFGAFGWIWGYVEKDFKFTMYSWGVGVAISVVLCVPDWPWFNRNPVEWRDSITSGGSSKKNSSQSGSSSLDTNKSKKKNKGKKA
uniref:Signal peptidase complex subunit 1 n=1 Tax=Octactis speculum TaxID=3111310 RepID=A0A6U3TG41_9STRA|mmetsp:Transcript_35973/g.48618  ORF Transcript_35973/g.48618 Transcript_35973/m.48618 type:complete len:103 (+) Transcript_35973:32-340(+)